MSKEQIKRRLNSYRHVQMERRQILERIMRLEARLTAPGAQNLDGMPHGSGRGDTLANGTAALSDLRDLYRAKEAELAQTQRDIEQLIENLDPIERVIARYRYIEGLHWEQICVKVNYSWRQTHRIHSEMIDKLAKELDEAKQTAQNALLRIAQEAQAVSPLKLGRMNGRHGGYYPVFASIDEVHELGTNEEEEKNG